MAVQQLSGITVFIYYGPSLISIAGFGQGNRGLCLGEDANIDFHASLTLNLPLAFVRLLGTIIAILVIDKRGRRTVLMRTIPIMFITLTAITVCFFLMVNHLVCEYDKWFTLGFTVLFLVTYSSGLDTIPWLVNAEIYPENLIGGASSFAASTNWILNFIMLITFNIKKPIPYLATIVTFNLLGFLFVWYFLVETQGNTNRKNIALILKIKQA